MAQNKNAIERYKILDSLLSNTYHKCTMQELNERCNEGLPPELQVGIRQTQKDIKFLEEQPPFYMDIKREKSDFPSKKGNRAIRKELLSYTDPSASIFKKKLSDDEKYLISEALNILGQFDGLPEMSELQALKSKLGIEDHRRIVSFAKNPMDDTTHFGKLFLAISNEQAIRLIYHVYSSPNDKRVVLVHPYLLKEYNKRWYLICGADDTGKILNFALDRVDDVIPMPTVKYKPSIEDLADRFDEIVGVTYREENPLEDIYFWVSDRSLDYILSKPIHELQIHLKGKVEEELRSKYSDLNGGGFFKIQVRENEELLRELTSFGKDLLVLAPSNIQDKIWDRILGMNGDYKKLRTN